MMIEFNIFSVLEQFEIVPLMALGFGFLDFSITNQTIFLLLSVSFLVIFFFLTIDYTSMSLLIIPTRLQSVFEILYAFILSTVIDSISGKYGQRFFPLIFSVFFFIVSLNLIGLIPYSFAVTSHIVMTLGLSLSIFIGINIISISIHKFKFFSLFLPAGSPLIFGFLLVPIELVLYFFRPLSLAIRLFSNIMAGHILLKVFASFSWALMGFSGVIFLFHYLPLAFLLPLFILEIGVALIQAFIFSLLLCIYIDDALNLH